MAPPSSYAASAPPGTSAIGIPEFALGALQPIETFFANPLQWGPFTAHPHISDSFTYSTGLTGGGGLTTATAVDRLSPGITILSQHLTFDYTPTLQYYIKGPYQDSLNHSASMHAAFSYGDWTFGIGQTYSKSSNPLIETGVQTETQGFGTSLTAGYRYSEKISFDFSATQQISESGGQNNALSLQNSKQWSTMEWADYHITSKTSLGLGVGGGFVDVEQGTDMTYEQFQGRVGWHPGPKLSLNLNGGVENRQFLSGGSPDHLSPLMGASLSYQLFAATSLSLSANRSVNTSIFQDQVTESASVSAGISQRLLQHLNATINAGYRTTDYQQSGSAAQFAGRKDDITFVSTSLGTQFLKKASASVSYMHSKNESTLAGFTYDSDQYTVQISYRF